MKYGLRKFFNRKNAVVYIALPFTVLFLVISIAAFALSTNKQPYPLTSFLKDKNFSYKLYFDQIESKAGQTPKQTCIDVNQKLFRDALKKIGATPTKPLAYFAKLGEDTIPADELAWLEALKHNLAIASGRMMDFSWETRTGTAVSLDAWKSDGNCPTGSLSWSPDYNGTGTWFEPYFLLNSDGSNGYSSWNAWPSLYRHLCFIEKNKDKYPNIKEFNGWNANYIDETPGKGITHTNYFEIGENLINYLTEETHIVKSSAFSKPPIDRSTAWAWERASQKVFNGDSAAQLNQKIGNWVNQSNVHALWLERFLDNQMAYIPLSQPQFATTTSLCAKWLLPRNNDSVNYRDYGEKPNTGRDSVNLAIPTRIFDATKSPLNPCFQDWPTSVTFTSELGTLVTWVSHGDISGSDKKGNLIKPEMYLQTSKEVVLYGRDEKGEDNVELGVIFRDSDARKEFIKKFPQKINPDILKICGKIDLTDEHLKNVLTKTTRYEFTIDTNLKWTDHNGQVQGNLSARDLERGLEGYWLSSASGLNRNGYFFGMANLDIKKTFETNQPVLNTTNSSFNDILSPQYDINKFQSDDPRSDTFNFYLTSPYLQFLDMVSKESFSPLPWQNPKVKNIATSQQTIDDKGTKGKVVLKNGQLDEIATDFSQLFGCGTNLSEVLDYYWNVGPYNISKITGNQVVFFRNKNSGYWDLKEAPWVKRIDPTEPNHEDPLENVILYYNTGNESVFYEKFLAGQLDYVPLQTMTKILAAYANRKLRNTILNFTPSKTFMANYIVYTGLPYRDENGNYVKQSNLTDAFYRMMEWWNDTDTQTTEKLDGLNLTHSDLSKIIRSVFFGMINFAQLARIQNSTGTFQYSLIPYGSMNVNYIDKEQKFNTMEFYHYISMNNDQRPGAMLSVLSKYTDALNDPCPFTPVMKLFIKEGD